MKYFTDSTPPPAITQIETIGSTQGLLDPHLFQWVKKTANSKYFGLVIAAAGISKPSQVGICLHFLAKPSIVNLLDLWSEHDADASGLKNLAFDLRAAPHILKLHPTVPSSKPLVDQYHGTVGQHQVLLLLAVRRPEVEPNTQNWFDALRLWTLVQGIRRIKNAPFQDELINLIAEKLRLAADGSSDWLDLISKIRGRIDSLATVSRETSSQAQAHKKTIVKDTHIVFLNTLGRVARGDARPLIQGGQATFSGLYEDDEPEQLGTIRETPFDHYTLNGVGEEDAAAAYRQDFGGTVTEIPETASSGKRALTGRGIQLRSAEQLQFLPWSWHTLNPIEQTLLNLQLTELEKSTDVKKQTLAWLTRVAIFTSRSMRLVVAITISQAPADDWQVTGDLRKLHRKPPRRNIRWTSGHDQISWIRPLGNAVELDLPAILAVSSEAPPLPNIKTLNDLWTKISPGESAETAFNTLCSGNPGLHRVTSGMASRVFAGQVYLQSEDAVLAQILSMGPRAGLGGSSAYGSWPSSRLRTVLKNAAAVVATPESPGEDKNAAGSELDPLDSALRKTITECEEVVWRLSKDPSQWIEHHNALVSYVVVALLAATGARPVNDPFESPALFDWEAARLFLADKVSTGRNGRLVPLVESAFKLIHGTYCEHLQTLAARIPASAELLANEIALLADRQESKKLPFFFFLRELPCLSWDSVTERALERSTYFNWPLPANLMRHRLSIRLRGMFLDTEIIDALLGHADQGVMCHGPESTRTWGKDMAVALPFLEESYRQLGFAEELPLQRTPPANPPAVESDQIFALTKAFGARARSEARMQYRQKARLEAKELIKKSIGKKPLESLEPEFWDKLAIDMLTIDGRRPHPKADVRYELLLRWQTAVAHTAKLRLKRVIILDRSFDSVFTAQSIGAEAKLKNLKTWFSAVVDQQPLSKSGIRHCLALATLDIAITCQMTAPQILTDILQKKNIRLVLVVDAAYVEHHPLLDEHPSAPVTRYRISRRCAQWLDKAMQSTISLEMTRWEMPEAWLTGLPTVGVHRSPNVTALIRKIAAVVQQANYLQRPGLVAGYLAGALPTSALPHRSWVLQDHQVILESTPSNDADRDAGTNEDTQTISVRSPVALFSSKAKISSTSKADDSDAQRAARIYIGSLTDLLNGFIRQSNDQLNASETDEQLTGGARQARRELVTALSRQVKANQETVSSAIWALGHWVVYLTQVPRKKNTPYAISTVLRYLSALSRRFIEMGCQFNLIGADSEEITDFYDEVLEIDRDLDLRYVVERLNAFHRYMQLEFKIEDADWDELDCGAAVPHGSPGTLGLVQYANALELLAPVPESATHHELASAFLLLLTFRFGLRAADAKGLKYEDFWLHDKMIVIHVQSNELRKLKRPASRRVVPLIEEISDFEWTVIHQFIDRAGLCRPDNGTFALFAINAKASRFDMRDLSARINHVLKRVCVDPNISHYKGRHAFANRISQALIAPDVSCLLGGGGKESKTFSDHVAKLLLGTAGPTRRAAWALARIMGHARPRTSFKSYVHLLPIWSDSWSEAEIITLDQKCLPKPMRCALALNVESSQPWQVVHEVVPVQTKQVAPTPAVIMSYLRLLRRGADLQAAARFVGISQELTDHIQKLLIGAESRIRSRTERAGRAPMQSLLNLISHAEWQTISTGCDEAQDNSVSDIQPLDLDQAIGMVSENRQLVMWKELHFQQVGKFIQYFKLAADVKVLKTTTLHPVVADWLEKYIPAELTDPADHSVRLDPVEEGVPPQQIKSRCAVIIRSAAGKTIGTGYGLILFWVIYLATTSK